MVSVLVLGLLALGAARVVARPAASLATEAVAAAVAVPADVGRDFHWGLALAVAEAEAAAAAGAGAAEAAGAACVAPVPVASLSTVGLLVVVVVGLLPPPDLPAALVDLAAIAWAPPAPADDGLGVVAPPADGVVVAPPPAAPADTLGVGVTAAAAPANARPPPPALGVEGVAAAVGAAVCAVCTLLLLCGTVSCTGVGLNRADTVRGGVALMALRVDATLAVEGAADADAPPDAGVVEDSGAWVAEGRGRVAPRARGGRLLSLEGADAGADGAAVVYDGAPVSASPPPPPPALFTLFMLASPLCPHLAPTVAADAD